MRRTAAAVLPIVFLDSLMMFAIVPLLPAYARSLHLSTAQIGLVVAVFSAAVLVLAPPVGHLAGRVGVRRFTIFGVALLAVSTLGYGAADSFWTLLAARAVQGASSAISWTAGMGWLSAATPADRRGRALGTAMAAATSGSVLGPLAGGPIGAAFGIRAPFVLMGGVAVALTVFAALSGSEPPQPPRGQPVRETLAAALHSPEVVAGLVVTAMVAVDSGALDTLVPLTMGSAGYGTGAITLVVVISGVIAVGVNQGVGMIYDRVGGVRIAIPAILVTAATLAGLSTANAVALAIAGFLIATPFISAQYAVAFPLCAAGADRAGVPHSSVFGLINLAWGLGFAAGPAIGAAVASAGTDRLAYGIFALLTLGVGIALRRLWHSQNQSADQPA